jgi:toxin YoeB
VKIVWHPAAWDEYVDWQTDDRKILKRINTLIIDVQRGDTTASANPNSSEAT